MKFLRLMKIVADASNSGGNLPRMKIVADAKNSGGNLLRKIAAENCCGNLLQKFAAENLGGHTKFLLLIICDRTMADVEISAPGQISAPLKFPRH
jgi:hypothetical protein